MGNTSSERAAMGQGEKGHRRDSRGTKEGERPKILMDSPEDADIFHGEDMKVSNRSVSGMGPWNNTQLFGEQNKVYNVVVVHLRLL